jgi:pilus assembly protein CpaF
MVQALNTGHDGSLATCHANSPADALRRIETMALFGSLGLPLAAVREQVRSAVDIVVQVSRQADGGRAVTAVSEVVAGPSRVRLLADGDRVVAAVQRPRLVGLMAS